MEEWQDTPRCSWACSHPVPGISPHIFLVLCTVGRKQFMRFEWASRAAEALGCDYEELNSATFKHHLRQILEQMTSGPQRQGLEDNEACSGTKHPRPHSRCPAPCRDCADGCAICFPCFHVFITTAEERCAVHKCQARECQCWWKRKRFLPD